LEEGEAMVSENVQNALKEADRLIGGSNKTENHAYSGSLRQGASAILLRALLVEVAAMREELRASRSEPPR
jgi:hypothetical protein